MAKTAAKSAASKAEAANPIAPLFADITPPVYADEIGEIRVYHTIARGRGQPHQQGKQVDFEEDEFVDANNGEVFEPVAYDTTEVRLRRVLQAVSPGMYWAQAYDQSGSIIQRAGRIVDATEDETEEPDMPEVPPPPQHAPSSSDSLAASLVPAIIGVLSQRQNEAASAPAIAAQMASVMMQKTPDNAVIEELRTELRSVRIKAEEEVSIARRKADSEIDEARRSYRRETEELRDQLRTERATAQRREDESRAEMRSVRDKAEAELVAYRTQATQQIYTLQQQNLELQQRAQNEIMGVQRSLMQTQFEKEMAERDARDTQNAIRDLEQNQQESVQNAVAEAAKDELPGWAKPFLRFAPIIIEYLKANGQKVPKQLEQEARKQSDPNYVPEQQQEEEPQPQVVQQQPEPQQAQPAFVPVRHQRGRQVLAVPAVLQREAHRLKPLAERMRMVFEALDREQSLGRNPTRTRTATSFVRHKTRKRCDLRRARTARCNVLQHVDSLLLVGVVAYAERDVWVIGTDHQGSMG